MMPAVALIGPDGAGKTTLTRMLVQSGLVRTKYVYMGIDIAASNFALPTSRLVERLKAERSASPGEGSAGAGSAARRPGLRRGAWVAARLANRVAEEWYRQLISWYFRLRGYAVVYDRHFVFDFAPELSAGPDEPADVRLHRWYLRRFYPRPQLVLFLDAPGTLLFARKGESTAEELERRRQAFLRVGERTPNFVRVDATRPLDEVYREITRHVLRACSPEGQRSAREVAS